MIKPFFKDPLGIESFLHIFMIFKLLLHLSKARYPIISFVSHGRLSRCFKQVILSIHANSEPTSYEVTSQQEKWKKFINDEL